MTAPADSPSDPSTIAATCPVRALRDGLATSAAIGGASERSIMKQTGHQSEKMVRRYIRDAEMHRDNAAAATGLC